MASNPVLGSKLTKSVKAVGWAVYDVFQESASDNE
jgi:hypothetical protein